MKTMGTLHPTDILTPPSTDSLGTMVAVAGTAQAFDSPTGAGMVNFSANVDYFVAFGSTNASIPTTSSTANTTANRSILNPTARNFGSTLSCTGLSIVCPSSGYVVLEWYRP